MVAVTEVSAAATVLGHASKFLSKLQQSKLATEHRTLVDQAMEVVADATQRLFSIQTKLLELQQENAALKQQLAAAEDWEKRLATYELVHTAGDNFVLKSLFKPEHFACLRCAEANKQLHVLQPNNTYAGGHGCPECETTYEVNSPSGPKDPNGSLRSGGGWT